MSDSEDLDFEDDVQDEQKQPEVPKRQLPRSYVKKLNYVMIEFIFPEVKEALLRVQSKVTNPKVSKVYAVLNQYVELYESLKGKFPALLDRERQVTELLEEQLQIKNRKKELVDKLNAEHIAELAEKKLEIKMSIDSEIERLRSVFIGDLMADEATQAECDFLLQEGKKAEQDMEEQLLIQRDERKYIIEKEQNAAEFSVIDKLEVLLDSYLSDVELNKEFLDLTNKLTLSMKELENSTLLEAKAVVLSEEAYELFRKEFIENQQVVLLSEETYDKFRKAFVDKHRSKKIITLIPRKKPITKTWDDYINIAQRAKAEAAAEAAAEKDMAGDEGSRTKSRVSGGNMADEDGNDDEAEGYASEEDELFGPLDSEDEEEPDEEDEEEQPKDELQALAKNIKKQEQAIQKQKESEADEEEKVAAPEEEEIVFKRPSDKKGEVDRVVAKRLGFQPREVFMYPEDQLMENIPGICELDPNLYDMITKEMVTIRMSMDKVHNIFNKLEAEVYRPFCGYFYDRVRPNMMRLLLNRCKNREFDLSTPLSEIVSCTDEQKFLLKKYLTERNELDIIQELSVRRGEIEVNNIFMNSSIGTLVRDIEKTTGQKLSRDMLMSQDPLILQIRQTFISEHFTESVSKRMLQLIVYLCVRHDTYMKTFTETSCVITSATGGLITPEQFLLIQEWVKQNGKDAEEADNGINKAVYTVHQLMERKSLNVRSYGLSEVAFRCHEQFMRYHQMPDEDKIIHGIPLLRGKNDTFRPGYSLGLIRLNNIKISCTNNLDMIQAGYSYLEKKVKYNEFESKFEELEESLPVFFRHLMIKSFDKTKLVRRPFYLKYLCSQVENVEQYLFLKYYMEHFPEEFRQQIEDFEIAMPWVKKIMFEKFPLVKIVNTFRTYFKKGEERVESVLDLIFKMTDNAKINEVHQLILDSSSDELDVLSRKFRELIPEEVSLSFPKCEYVFMKHYQERFRNYFGITFNISFNGTFGDMSIIRTCLGKLQQMNSGLLAPVSLSEINDLVLKETGDNSDVNPEFISDMVSIIRQEQVIKILKSASKPNPEQIVELQKRMEISKIEAEEVLLLEQSLEKYNIMVPVEFKKEQPFVKSYFYSYVLQVYLRLKEQGLVFFVKHLSPKLQQIIRKKSASIRSSVLLKEMLKESLQQKINIERRLVESPQYADRMAYTCEQIQTYIDSICSKPLRAFTDKREQKKRVFLLYQLIYEFILVQLRSDIEKQRQAIQQEVLARLMGKSVERSDLSQIVDNYEEQLSKEQKRDKQEIEDQPEIDDLISRNAPSSLVLRDVEKDVFRSFNVDRYVELYFEKCSQLKKEFSTELPQEIANATLADISEKRASEIDNDPIIPKVAGIVAKFRNEIPYGVVRPTEFIRYAYYARNQTDIPPPISIDQSLVLFMNNVIFLHSAETERLRQNPSVSAEYIENIISVGDHKFVKPSLLFIQRLTDTCLIRGDHAIIVDDIPYQLGRVVMDRLTNVPVTVAPFSIEEYEQLMSICQKRLNQTILGRRKIYVKMSVMKPGYYLPLPETDIQSLKQEYEMLEAIKRAQLFIPVDKEVRRSELKEMIEAIENNWVIPSYELLKLISDDRRRFMEPLVIDGVEYRFGIFNCGMIQTLNNENQGKDVMISSKDLIQHITNYFLEQRRNTLEQINFVEDASKQGAKIGSRVAMSNFEGTKHKNKCHVCKKPIQTPYLITLATPESPKLVWICSGDCSENFELMSEE